MISLFLLLTGFVLWVLWVLKSTHLPVQTGRLAEETEKWIEDRKAARLEHQAALAELGLTSLDEKMEEWRH
jgi:hypothetical protein